MTEEDNILMDLMLLIDQDPAFSLNDYTEPIRNDEMDLIDQLIEARGINVDDDFQNQNVGENPDAPVPGTDTVEIDFGKLNLDEMLSTGVRGIDRNEMTEYIGDTQTVSKQAATPSENPIDQDQEQATKSLPQDNPSIKISNLTAMSGLKDSQQFIQTGGSLTLTEPPVPFQRARYLSDLEKSFRYISVADNKKLTLQTSDIRGIIAPSTSILLRMTRTTTTNHAGDGTVAVHPYPILMNNECTISHQGSLLIPIDDQIRNHRPIEISELIILRLKDRELKQIKQLPVYTPNSLTACDHLALDRQNPKKMRYDFGFRCFALHFQIFLVDTTGTAWPTDLMCQTEAIYEYEHKDLKNIPIDARQPRQKRRPKRLATGPINDKKSPNVRQWNKKKEATGP